MDRSKISISSANSDPPSQVPYQPSSQPLPSPRTGSHGNSVGSLNKDTDDEFFMDDDSLLDGEGMDELEAVCSIYDEKASSFHKSKRVRK